MLTSFIRLLLVFTISANVFSQENTITSDSIEYKQKYGLRVGMDINKLVNSSLNNNYNGIELNADYRLNNKLYIAAEIGFSENNVIEEYLDFTSKGNYLKAGIDYNMYNNWLSMQNMILKTTKR